MPWTSRRLVNSALVNGALLLNVLLLLAAASPAWAEAPSVGLVVLPVQGGELSSGRPVARRLMRGLAGDQGANLVDLLGVVEQLSRPARPDYLESLQAGLEQLTGGNYNQARRSLSRVWALMNGSLASVPLEELAFVQLHMAAAELGSGRRSAARRILTALATWRQGRLPALSGQAPTDWEDLLAGAISPGAGQATLEVMSAPEGAAASLDGKPLGRTPVVATNLPPGTHYLEVSLPGYRPSVTAVTVRSRRRALSVRLDEDPTARAAVDRLFALRHRLGETRLAGVGGVGRQLGLDKVLLVTWTPGGDGLRLHGYLYDTATERLKSSARIVASASPDPAALQPLALWRSGASVASPPGDDPNQPGRASVDGARPWFKRWYVWVLAGAVLAAAVAVPVALTTRDDGTPDEQFVIRW